jgi:hypothetical protein
MAKKTTSSSKSSSASGTEKKSAPKSPAGGAKSAAPKAPASSTPAIDTRLAANAAASLIANKGSRPQPNAGAKKESGAFRQLKQQAAKPTTTALGGILDPGNITKKSNQPAHFQNQQARNQTYGADVTRSGVPRRNAG